MSAVEWRQAESLSPESTLVRCRKCRGTGVRRDEPCWRCQGTGRIDPGVLPPPQYPSGSFSYSDGVDRRVTPEWDRPPERSAEEVAEQLQERLDAQRLGAAQQWLRLAVKVARDPVPCLEPGPDLWLSEDPAQRRQAVERCKSCPVIEQCGDLADAMPPQQEVWGVFGGRDYASDDPAAIVAQLQALQRAALTLQARSTAHGAGAVLRARRAELLAKLAEQGWSERKMAAAAGLSHTQVRTILGRLSATWRQDPERARAGKVIRRAKHEAEVAARNDPRVARLRELAPLIEVHQSSVLRAERWALLLEMRTEDPQFWTLERLAVASGVADGRTIHKQLSLATRPGGPRPMGRQSTRPVEGGRDA